MAACNMYRKFGEIWTCGFCDMQSDRQTNKQTYRHTDDNTLLPSWGRNNYPLTSFAFSSSVS